MNDQVTKAKKIIADNMYMTISTSSLDGQPWVSPVFFAYDDKYNLYWVSNKEAKHSQLIQQNPKAAIVVFDSTAPEGKGDGVYFECEVAVLASEEDISRAREVLGNRVSKEEFKIKNISEVTENGVWRIYRAAPSRIFTLTEGKFINGQYVDEREEITL